ncbi:MAG TPA: hypothetical protein VNO31_35060, partial [Umezawaea sp.]|nr:hypothetical protein [Umezawaea sp.]
MRTGPSTLYFGDAVVFFVEVGDSGSADSGTIPDVGGIPLEVEFDEIPSCFPEPSSTTDTTTAKTPSRSTTT